MILQFHDCFTKVIYESINVFLCCLSPNTESHGIDGYLISHTTGSQHG